MGRILSKQERITKHIEIPECLQEIEVILGKKFIKFSQPITKEQKRQFVKFAKVLSDLAESALIKDAF